MTLLLLRTTLAMLIAFGGGILGVALGKVFVRTAEGREVFDHDFPSFAKGVVIPHGIYDLKRNRG